MVKCSRCKSKTIASVSTKSPDGTRWLFGGHEEEGIPDGVGVGYGEYTQFAYCLDCGQIQGDWPCPKRAIDKAHKKAAQAKRRLAREEKERAKQEKKLQEYREWASTPEGQREIAERESRMGDLVVVGLRMAELAEKEGTKTITMVEEAELEGLRAQVLGIG